MSIAGGGTFMKERAVETPLTLSEPDPPAANQPLGGGDLGESSLPTPDAAGADEPYPAAVPAAAPTQQAPPGKPDGEVDTRP
jgi:hypothetical protein